MRYSDRNVAFRIPVAATAPSIIDLLWSPSRARGAQTTAKVRSKLCVLYLDVVPSPNPREVASQGIRLTLIPMQQLLSSDARVRATIIIIIVPTFQHIKYYSSSIF